MSLPSGTRLGPYEIVAPLGAGGMGEVYRATDTHLKRSVAIKVLPAAMASDADRLARFQREAEVLAALNHPNIAAIYGLEKTPDLTALVMELVEGEDLSAHISRGALPLSEALPIARQIADALEAAHEQGIIHRDLKPGNVKVRADGTVKVLDFGLAKAMDPAGASSADAMNSPTLTNRATQVGMILGTAAYMAPEQAKGRTVDRRADVWAFGVVFYEMLTGQRAFKGDDVSETLASVLAREPDLSALPADTPAPVRRLIARCLEKDPKARIRAIGDAMRRLDEDLAARVEPVRREQRASGLRPWVLAAGLTAGVLIGAVAVWFLNRPNDSLAPVRMLAAQVEALSVDRDAPSILAVAPDGSYVIYAAGTPGRLYMRRLDQMESVAIPGTEGASSPFISPNGESIGFLLRNQIRVIARSGGASSLLHTFADSIISLSNGGAWAPDGTIYFGAGHDGYGTIWRIPPGGGTAELLLPLADDRGIRREDAWPQVLPGGKTLLFGTLPGDVYWECRQAKIRALDLASRTEKLVLDRACFVQYVEPGHVIFVTAENQLSIAPFDATTLELTGPPRPLPFEIPLRARRFANLAAADDGALVYESGPPLPKSHLIWFDRSGKEVTVTDQPRGFETVRLSPQADRIATVITGPDGVGRIWMYDIARGQLSPVSPAGPQYRHLAWTPDGRSVLALRTAEGVAGIYRITVDGPFAETLVYDPKTPWAAPWSVSPDGRWLSVMIWRTDTDKDWDIQIAPLEGSGPPVNFGRESANEKFPVFSPDGRWLAYTSDRSGRDEVFVKRFPEAGAPVQISRVGGRALFWDREGTAVFSLNVATGQVMASTVNLRGDVPVAGESRVVFDMRAGLRPEGWSAWSDRSADSQRLLLMSPVASESRTLGVALNFLR